MEHISKNYFTFNELFTKCTCTEVFGALSNLEVTKNIHELWFALNVIRKSFDKPIRVNSGYRDFMHNRDVGGFATSQHLQGSAADISAISYADNKELLEVIKANRHLFGQVLAYINEVEPSDTSNIIFIHVALPCPKHPKFDLDWQFKLPF